MKKAPPDRSCLAVSLVIISVTGMIIGAYAFGRFQGGSAAWSQIASPYIKSLSVSEEQDERLLREQVANDGQAPFQPGSCILTVFGSNTFTATVVIVRREGKYYLRSTNKNEDEQISSDGKLFAWSPAGYGHDRYIGTIHNGKVIGRLYYWHGTDIGLEHFEVRPKESAQD